MPSPKVPPIYQILVDIKTATEANTVAVQALQAEVAAQGEDIIRTSQLLRYLNESSVGADANITGIWDGTDRYL